MSCTLGNADILKTTFLELGVSPTTQENRLLVPDGCIARAEKNGLETDKIITFHPGRFYFNWSIMEAAQLLLS